GKIKPTKRTQTPLYPPKIATFLLSFAKFFDEPNPPPPSALSPQHPALFLPIAHWELVIH
ncbi:MAG TPA: hypothetical protein VGQ99_13340, partial [Tepidisphaeraceae bacterium]|nr:hypothetical protein [Tepidisphaeraceae bacterium]